MWKRHSPEPVAQTVADAQQLRDEAAQRIVREALERDKVALELATKTIFRRGNVS